MHAISAEVVESTWHEVGSLDPRAARHLMQEAAARQPALLAYVMASTAHSRSAVQETAVYLYYVILQMFERGAPRRLSPIPTSVIDELSERTDAELGRLMGAHERFLERAAELQALAQPHVVRYLAEALFEDEESDLTEQEEGLLFLTLKIVIDALDEASSATDR